MKLKQKVLKLLDVYYADDTPDSHIQRDLSRRGKIDQKKVIEILFLIIEEIDKEEVEEKKEVKETKRKK